jgi:methyl-accepting chemotaxis protein
MPEQKYKRSLRSVRLTRKFHFRYMGLWMLLAFCQVLILNFFLYLHFREGWELNAWGAGLEAEYAALRTQATVAMAAEVVFFTLAIVGMGIMTAHRIAGPYLRLKATFKDVGDGNLSSRLRFRQYDGLEDVEQAFNEMMDKLRARFGQKPG